MTNADSTKKGTALAPCEAGDDAAERIYRRMLARRRRIVGSDLVIDGSDRLDDGSAAAAALSHRAPADDRGPDPIADRAADPAAEAAARNRRPAAPSAGAADARAAATRRAGPADDASSARDPGRHPEPDYRTRSDYRDDGDAGDDAGYRRDPDDPATGYRSTSTGAPGGAGSRFAEPGNTTAGAGRRAAAAGASGARAGTGSYRAGAGAGSYQAGDGGGAGRGSGARPAGAPGGESGGPTGGDTAAGGPPAPWVPKSKTIRFIKDHPALAASIAIPAVLLLTRRGAATRAFDYATSPRGLERIRQVSAVAAALGLLDREER